MKIYVDADACPKVIKEILFRSSQRLRIDTLFVANQHIHTPRSPFLISKVVSHGFDEADNWIVDQCVEGDLVISQDIPLASEAIKKGATVISPKGVLFTEDNIRQRLGMRNFMEELRGAGENIGGPAAFNQTDQRNFANQLDRWLQQNKNN